MATVTTVTYAADSALAITLTGPLTTGLYRSSANFDNDSSSNFVDCLVGGMIGSAGTSWAAGETVNIYLMAAYSDTSTDVGGARDAAYAEGDGVQTADTDFIAANLGPLVAVIGLHATPTTDMDYHWGPVSVASAFGGVVPKNWHVLVHNNTSGSIDSGNINVQGITYTST
jgi:hypothetical protein